MMIAESPLGIPPPSLKQLASTGDRGGDRGRNDMEFRWCTPGIPAAVAEAVGVHGQPGGDRGRNDMDI